eukprot:10319567-Ditylum_brightwellii.AAC.1
MSPYPAKAVHLINMPCHFLGVLDLFCHGGAPLDSPLTHYHIQTTAEKSAQGTGRHYYHVFSDASWCFRNGN